jgi:PucR C-terminal helix-turn-helix domain
MTDDVEGPADRFPAQVLPRQSDPDILALSTLGGTVSYDLRVAARERRPMKSARPVSGEIERGHQVTVGELADRLAAGLLVLVTDGRAPDRHLEDVSLWDAESAASVSGCAVAVLGQRDVVQLTTVLESVADAGGTGLIIEDIAGRAAASLTDRADELGVALWQRGSRPWLDVIDAVRSVLASAEDADRFNRVDVPRGDLTSLADTLADLLGGPVIIEDDRFHVLSYSSFTGEVDRGRDMAILGRQVPTEWFNHLERVGALNTLLTSDHVVDLSDGPWQARRRILTAVHASGHLIGILWVAEGARPLPDDVADRMREATRIAAPRLLQYRESLFAERSERARLLQAVLHGGTISLPLQEELDLVPAASHVVLGLRMTASTSPNSPRHRRLVDAADLHLRAYHWRAATTSVGGTTYCLIAVSSRQRLEHVRQLADSLVRTLSRIVDSPLHIAISDPSPRLSTVAELRSQVDDVLGLLDGSAANQGRAMGYADAVAGLVLDQAAAAAKQPSGHRFAKLDNLRAYDRRHGSDYTVTLAAYLNAFGDINAAATALGIHRTTMRYRLRRITELALIDIDDPSERLLCALLLREPSVPNRRP